MYITRWLNDGSTGLNELHFFNHEIIISYDSWHDKCLMLIKYGASINDTVVFLKSSSGISNNFSIHKMVEPSRVDFDFLLDGFIFFIFSDNIRA